MNLPEDELMSTMIQETECFICLNEVTDAHMCPYCYKCGCKECYINCLSKKKECPLCRHELREEELKKSDFLNEMRNVI